ncbi:unnamed protein product [Prorocentrum cordatum]|uniref:TFIIS N-terminal domain-containing protein n=1 Tax=Prorocentrum cordatum TaxID=2364126 RepID=A0ABN9RP48_9DINO|nr:unnamed protein product [Polarella glacialis]
MGQLQALPVGSPNAPREQLAALAARLRATPAEDAGAVCEILEALSAVPATVALLRATQLGLLTQPLKDHADRQVRSAARRLRRGWKDIVSEAREKSAGGSKASTASTSRRQALGSPRRGATGGACGDSASAVDALSPVSRAGAAWSRIRTPSPEACAPAPHAPPAWRLGALAEMPPQWAPQFAAEPATLPRPAAPLLATAVPLGGAPAREARPAMTRPECAPPDGSSVPKSCRAALSGAAVPSQHVTVRVRAPPGLSRGWRTPDPSPTRIGAAMPSQLVSVRVRAPPGLSRGWRTPDPSPTPTSPTPTRTSNGLLNCATSAWKVMDLPDGLDDRARGSPSALGQRERAADTACASTAPRDRGRAAVCLQLEPRIDDRVLVEASTPRGHDHQDARRAPVRGAASGACGDSASAAHALSSVAMAGASPVAAWTRIRTPSPEGRLSSAPHAPPAWQWGALAEKPPQWMPFRQPAAEPAPPPPPPPPPAPVGTAAPPGQGPVRKANFAAARQETAPPDGVGVPRSSRAVLSVGSVGHPYACQAPCKYVRKARGCKDGAACDRCHACFPAAARQAGRRPP